MDNKILVVVGMHRSGTSLTTNWLQQCGLNIGSELEGKKFSNPDGHFEDVDFLYLHEEILKSKEVPYHGTENPNDFNINQTQKKAIKDLLENKKSNQEWGWKDPRTCLFLGVYRELIPDANYLVVIRSYSEIIDSLLRRKYTPIENRIKKNKLGSLKLLKYRLTLQRRALNKEILYYENSVINYYSSIIKHLELINDKKRICFKLDDLQDLDQQILFQLNKQMSFSLDYFPISKIFNKKYLKSNLKYYKPHTQNTVKLNDLQNQLESFVNIKL